MNTNMQVNDTSKWLSKAKQWQDDEDVLAVVKDQTENIHKITAFLSELGATLQISPSVADRLRDIPEVGQLLGRLVTFPKLLLDPDLYRSLLTCILSFYVDEPNSPVEYRAKLWVVSQIKQMICHSDDNIKKDFPMTLCGHNLEDGHAHCLEEVGNDVLTPLLAPSTSIDNVDVIKLCNICYICLSLRNISAFDKLFTSSLKMLITNSPTGNLVLKLLKDIEDTQRHPYTAGHQVVPLCCEGQVILWSSSLSSLEHEVLDLVEKIMKMSPLFIVDIMKSRHLVQACSSQPHIYAAVFDMLAALLEHSNGHWKVGNLTHTLHMLVRDQLYTDQQDSLNLLVQYSEPIQPLINLLLYKPKDLNSLSFKNHIKLIDQWLTSQCSNMSDCKYRELILTFIHFQEWYISILCYIFICDKEMFPCCMRTLSVLCEGHGNLNEQRQNVIQSLKCLYKKHQLTSVDIQCAVNEMQSGENDPRSSGVITDQLLCRTLLVFCVLSEGGYLVLSEVLNMVCGTQASAHDQLELLLFTITKLQNLGCDSVRINQEAKDWLISAISEHSSENCDKMDRCELVHQTDLALGTG